MHLTRRSVFRLAHPIPLYVPDGFVQSLGCPEILQDFLAILSIRIPH